MEKMRGVETQKMLAEGIAFSMPAKYYFQVSFVVLIDCYPSVFSHHVFEEWPSQMQNTSF